MCGLTYVSYVPRKGVPLLARTGVFCNGVECTKRAFGTGVCVRNLTCSYGLRTRPAHARRGLIYHRTTICTYIPPGSPKGPRNSFKMFLKHTIYIMFHLPVRRYDARTLCAIRRRFLSGSELNDSTVSMTSRSKIAGDPSQSV